MIAYAHSIYRIRLHCSLILCIGGDGEDGDDGEDGEDGREASDFQLMIEFESEDLSKGWHTFRVELAGSRDKDVHHITIDISKTIILVFGRGGSGGRG